MYYEWTQTHKKTITICVAAFITMLFIWGVATLITRNGKVGVTISVVPSDATVLLDGKNIGNGTHWITPGIYKVEAKKDGFFSRDKTLEAFPSKEHNVVALSLPPESSEAQKWFDAHPDEYKKNETYGAIEARSNGEYFREKYSIINSLPYTDPYYKIGYRASSNNTLVVTITTPSPRYRYFAVQKFRELGFNPTDYRIEFVDYQNPLGDKNE